MTAQELFYPRDSVVGRLLSLPPHVLFLRLFLAAFVILILPAQIAGVLNIPQESGNVGFWHSFNWSLMYLFVAPLIFAIASSITGSLPERIKSITNPNHGAACIVPLKNSGAIDYATDFSTRFEQWSTWIILGAIIVAIMVDTVDSWKLWTALLHGSTRVKDWSGAFSLSPYNGWVPPSFRANVAFDVIAYIFQGAYIFLAFYWVAKCGFFFITFSHLMIGKDALYKFTPKDAHPTLRMGLRPLSSFFNSFLLMTCIFLGFILYHRFQLIEQYCHLDFPGFVSKVLEGMKKPSVILNVHDPIYGLGCMDVGMWLLLSLLLIPIVVIAFFPLGILRRHAAQQRDDRIQELGAKLEEALADETGDQTNRIKSYDDRIKRLQNASIWPNGDRAALYFLGAILVLAAAAWLPPLLILLGATGIGGILLRELRTLIKSREA